MPTEMRLFASASVDLPWLSRAVYRVRLMFARRMAAVRLHRWYNAPDFRDRGGLGKYRTGWAGMLITLGNLYLRAQGTLSEVLARRTWLEWEAAVAAQLGREIRILGDQRGLEFPLIPGSSLEDLLRGGTSLQDKLRGIRRSAMALRKVHQITLSAGGLRDWPLSHGDAWCRNVIVDEPTGIASWIDFDMRHRPQLPPLLRHADDLRALIWSSAFWLETSAYQECVAAACDGYADREVAHEVSRLMSKLNYPTVFQLAQAPLSSANFVCLREAVRRQAQTPDC